MTALILDLDPQVYEQIRKEAERTGQPVEAVAEAWLTERAVPARSPSAAAGERERTIQILRDAGLVAAPTPDMLARAAQATATLEEVQAAFARAGGKPLSEIVLEQRGPKA